MVKQRGSINTAGDSLTFSPTVISSTSTLTCVYLCTGADKSRKMSDKRAFSSKSCGIGGGGGWLSSRWRVVLITEEAVREIEGYKHLELLRASI